jgi:hypothetical protein
MEKPLNVTPLTNEELTQLQSLLIRYAAYHAANIANETIAMLLSKFRATPVIDLTPIPESGLATVSPKRSRRKARP